jgi:hypothetical protein
LRWLWYS